MLSARWLHAHPEQERPRPGAEGSRTCSSASKPATSARPGTGCWRRQTATPGRRRRHPGPDRPALSGHPQGPVPDPGHRPVAGPHRDGPVSVSYDRMSDLQQAGRSDHGRSGRRQRRLVHRRRQAPTTPRSTPARCRSTSRPIAPVRRKGSCSGYAQARGQRPRRDPLPPAHPGPDHRRRDRPHRSTACLRAAKAPTPPRSRNPGRQADSPQLAKVKAVRNVYSRTRRRTGGQAAYVDIDRDTAARLSITASRGRRRPLQRFRRSGSSRPSSPRTNQYRVILEAKPARPDLARPPWAT
ncbi:hypothetical protein ACRAWD_21375 [Caulobacter segnis]